MDAPTRKLISIEEAQRLVLARVEPPADGDRSDRGARAGGCSRRRAAPRSTCRPSTARRWTASRCAPPTARAGCRSRFGSPPGAPLRGRSSRERRWGSPPAASFRPERMPSSPSSMLSKMTTRSSYRKPSTWARASALRAATCAAARWSVDAGARLGPAQVGALAAAGVAEVLVARRPRAAVLATGSELRRPGELLEPGQIYEANGLLLAAQLESAGAEVERLSSVADDEAAHREALARGLAADVLVTSGGVSVGPHDLVRMVEAELGVEEVFWGVAMKPGKPISFGVLEGRLVFGLPGNPVSALVGFELFVRPALLALQGAADPLPRFERGRLRPRARAERAPGRARPRAAPRRWRRAGARSAARARVAHDRAGGRGGRARARADGRERALGGRFGRVPPVLGPDGAFAVFARRSACAGRRGRPSGRAAVPARAEAARPRSDTARSGPRRPPPAARRPRARRRPRAARRRGHSRSRRAAPGTTARRSRGRTGRRTSRAAATGLRTLQPATRPGAPPAGAAACGSQIQAWSEGRTNRTEYGFIATSTSEMTASASRAPIWPASSSSSPTGRRGSRRSRAKSQADGRGRRRTRTRPTTGQSVPGESSGASGLAAPVSQIPRIENSSKSRAAKTQNASRLR